MQEYHFLPVNWIDGMKINKSHFIAQENAMMYRLAQHTSCLLNELNYGILPAGVGGADLRLFVSTDNQRKVQVRVQQCRAITAGGYYIEFGEDTVVQGATLANPVANEPVNIRDLKNKGEQFYVILTVNPYKRQPHGLINTAEVPPRLPFTVPTLSVDLLPVEEVRRNVLGAFQLPVGKISVGEQGVILEEDYIPPCTSIASHPELRDIHAGLEEFYGKMEIYSLQVIQKIMQKKQQNDMSAIVQKLCENILAFTASQLAELGSAGMIQAPVSMIVKVASLSRLIKNTIDSYVGAGKEELISYFTEWCNVSQGELEGIIIELSTHRYDHMDINNSLGRVTEFTRIISGLFQRLAKLEYIGKRKEAGIFVKEEVVKQGDPAPKRRSFLAD